MSETRILPFAYKVTVWRDVPILGWLGFRYLRESYSVSTYDSLNSVVELATRDRDQVRVERTDPLRLTFD